MQTNEMNTRIAQTWSLVIILFAGTEIKTPSRKQFS